MLEQVIFHWLIAEIAGYDYLQKFSPALAG